MERQGVANGYIGKLQILRHGGACGFGLINQKDMNAGGTKCGRRVAADHFGRFLDGLNCEAKRRDAGQLAEVLEGDGERTGGMTEGPQRNKRQPLAFDGRGEVLHLKVGHGVTSPNELAAERSEGIHVAEDWRSDNAESPRFHAGDYRRVERVTPQLHLDASQGER
jgi:hypothetical protein